MEMVPLFIITPDHRNRYEHDAIASYLEIAPTILHATGIKYSYRSQGVDLLNNMSLKQSVIYRGQPYNRSELFKEMSEAFKDSLNYEN
jgi:arylsulfatase A-like enzyme